MNQELMNMVQQAVNSIPDHVDFEIPNAFAEAFASLVAAAEREKVEDLLKEYDMVNSAFANDFRARGDTK